MASWLVLCSLRSASSKTVVGLIPPNNIWQRLYILVMKFYLWIMSREGLRNRKVTHTSFRTLTFATGRVALITFFRWQFSFVTRQIFLRLYCLCGTGRASANQWPNTSSEKFGCNFFLQGLQRATSFSIIIWIWKAFCGKGTGCKQEQAVPTRETISVELYETSQFIMTRQFEFAYVELLKTSLAPQKKGGVSTAPSSAGTPSKATLFTSVPFNLCHRGRLL